LRWSSRYRCCCFKRKLASNAQGSSMTANEAITHGAAELSGVGTGETARLESRMLLMHSLRQHHDTAKLLSDKAFLARALQPFELLRFFTNLERRKQGEPVCYITGHKEFWGLPFQVTADTLVPRPDSETLIETCVEHFASKNGQPKYILDLGTGSGCLLVSLLHRFEHAKGIGTDINQRALQVAHQNAARHRAETRARFHKIDWLNGSSKEFLALLDELEQALHKRKRPFEEKEAQEVEAVLRGDYQCERLEPLAAHNSHLMKRPNMPKVVVRKKTTSTLVYPQQKTGASARFDVVISNPPYVSKKDIEKGTVEPAVLQHEPKEALYGGEDGLDVYRLFAKSKVLPEIVEEGGLLVLEIGKGQGDQVRKIFKTEGSGFDLQRTKNDIAGVERCLVFVKRK